MLNGYTNELIVNEGAKVAFFEKSTKNSVKNPANMSQKTKMMKFFPSNPWNLKVILRIFAMELNR
ncbi:hypothetical protein DR864_26935 [Runella rosea]|uniref:Uncharacterized protein n=1 Tax=Runella rosea TaxID=2259595 RepID=A0A344TR41_9BACT|nr:hypothetical protein DR864_26935 [Runella rosea]